MTVRLAAVLAALMLLLAAAAHAQDSVYNEPVRANATFTFDDKVWRVSPPDARFGVRLTCIADGCRPDPFPMSARCAMAFRANGNPDRKPNTAIYLRGIDNAAWLRMRSAFLAAPLMAEGAPYQGYEPCAARPGGMCAKVALRRPGMTPGLGLLFVEVHGNHLIEGDCHVFDESVPRAQALFDNFLSGLRLKSVP